MDESARRTLPEGRRRVLVVQGRMESRRDIRRGEDLTNRETRDVHTEEGQ